MNISKRRVETHDNRNSLFQLEILWRQVRAREVLRKGMRCIFENGKAKIWEDKWMHNLTKHI